VTGRRAARRTRRERDDVEMPGRPIGRRLAAWTASLALLGVIAVVGATPAAADPTAPPWVTGPLPPGAWIAYTLSNTGLTAFQRNPSKWGPVLVTRQGDGYQGLLASDSAGGWPSTWPDNGSGVTLERADAFCALSQQSCNYYVTSGAGRPFFFGAAIPPSGGGPAHDLSGFNNGPLNLAPPPQLVATFNPPLGGALPSSGSFTFDGSASHDDRPGNLDYHWTLTSQSGAAFNQEGGQSTFTPPASIFNQNGQYCVTLVVTASDHTTAHQGPSCFAVTISNPQPAPPQAPPPAPPQAAPTPNPPAAGPTPAASLSFAKPLPNFAVPVPGAVQQVTVIWLWKPDWFQPTPSGVGKAVRTAGRAKAAKRASVSVTQNAHRSSPSAAPWLAGLGAFGIFGAGWAAFRRRNLRSSLLD
jgi:hypothetical protein